MDVTFEMIYTKICLIWFKLVSFLFSSEGESNVGELLKAKADEGVKVKKSRTFCKNQKYVYLKQNT